MTNHIRTNPSTPSGLRYNPYEHAAILGIEVLHRPLRTCNGLWLPDRNLIVVRSGMRALHDRSTLAHEIAHAELGHRDDRPKHEKAADRRASRRLIKLEEVQTAIPGAPDEHRLALDLNVSTRMLREFLSDQPLAS